MNRLTLASIIFLLATAIFIFYRTIPDEPTIVSGGRIFAGVDEAAAVESVRDSELYRSFDRSRKITTISISPELIDGNSTTLDVLSTNLGKEIKDHIYVVLVKSTAKCPDANYLVFYVNATDAAILRTKVWTSCEILE